MKRIDFPSRYSPPEPIYEDDYTPERMELAQLCQLHSDVMEYRLRKERMLGDMYWSPMAPEKPTHKQRKRMRKHIQKICKIQQ